MDIDKLIERLRTESLYKDKATLEIMDLCMEAAEALSTLRAELEQAKREGMSMERLTYWCDDGQGGGEWRVNIYGREESGPHVDRLAAYEETGVEPEEIAALISPPNDPLTLEELREMDGDKIYIQHIGACKGFLDDEYAPYYSKLEQYVQKYNGMLRACDLPSKYYGEAWRAYRRNPEGGEA